MNEVAFDFSSGIAPLAVRAGALSAGRDARAPGMPALRECSVCDELKPAKEFRAVVGRIRTEACGECCDLRDEVTGGADALGHAAVAAFCLRVANKRFEKFQSAKNDGRLPVNLARSLRSGAPLFPQDKAAPNFSGKEKSALAKDPKEY